MSCPGSQPWSSRKDAGFSYYQTSIIPNVTSLSLAETYSMWEIANPSRWRSAWRPHTEWYPKRYSALYHTSSSVIYWACRTCLYFLQRRNEHKKLTHIFCQLPSRVNPPTHFGKQILDTCGLSVPHSIYNSNYLLWIWIHPSLLNKSFYASTKHKSLGLRWIPLLTVPQAPGFLANVASPARDTLLLPIFTPTLFQMS